ncbi:MAG: hypothetical protein KDA24_17565 [Deltaproteobacteria bacterium]|nr:hypothetical protein [Deltaproteobacteria bacterium]
MTSKLAAMGSPHTRPLRARRLLWLLLLVPVVACPSAEPDPGDLPDETPALLDDDDDDATAPMDDDDDINDQPENVLTVQESGVLTRSPTGGPYTAITGQLTITELLNGEAIEPLEPGGEPMDGDLPPTCEVLYAVVGTRADSEDECPTCDATWALTFSVDTGTPDWCMGPEQPGDGDVRLMGFTQSQQAMYWDYQDLGTWVWWYQANETGDDIAVSWTTTLGVEIDDN